MYSYHAYRIFVPIFAISLALLFLKDIKKMVSKILVPAIFIAILLIPLAKFTFSPEGKIRATTQTAFKGENFDKARLDYDQKSKKPLRFMSKYLYQKPVYYAFVAVNGYLDHFSPIFLFFKGDQTGRHSQVDMGQIYVFELLFLTVGLLKFKPTTGNKIMLSWLLISPVPAMIVEPTPHAYRTLQMVIPLAYFSASGALIIMKAKDFTLLKIIFALIALYYFLLYLHLMFVHYPKKFSADWQDGYKQMVQKVTKYENDYEKIYITNINQVPYIYMLFFTKYNPRAFVSMGGTKDHFGKYFFVSPDEDVYNKGRILYVAPSWQKVDGKWIDAVDDSNRKHIYSLWEVEGRK